MTHPPIMLNVASMSGRADRRSTALSTQMAAIATRISHKRAVLLAASAALALLTAPVRVLP